MRIEVDASEYMRLDSEKDLRYFYPEHVWGTNRPQPWTMPDKYPCLYKEIAVMYNSQGSDHAMLTYLYDFVELPE